MKNGSSTLGDVLRRSALLAGRSLAWRRILKIEDGQFVFGLARMRDLRQTKACIGDHRVFHHGAAHVEIVDPDDFEHRLSDLEFIAGLICRRDL